MKEKGFTLIELLAVLLIIGVVSAIVVPKISHLLSSQKEALHNQQYQKIENIAEDWATKNLDKISSDGHITYVSLATLIEDEKLDLNAIIDPANEQSLDGCVAIKYEIAYHNYDFTFININDKNYHNECNQAI